MTVTVTDLFCGAGGSTTGAAAAGATIALAANHWSTAIEIHQANHPDSRHDCADISQVDPRRYPRTDILIASPECTNHSQARGVSRKQQDPSLCDAPDPAAERSRATMWDVPRFAEQMDYTAIIVENVVEATKWVGWRAWCVAMDDLGYTRHVTSRNSMHHGVAQSRDRLYVVFTKRGLKADLELELTGWCPRCDGLKPCRQAFKPERNVGRYKTQYLYRCTTCGNEVAPATNPAATIIDWSMDCPRIGDRAKPLADKTRRRILAGLERYVWAPIITSGAGNGFERTPGNRARSVSDDPVPTQTCSASHAMATPPESLMIGLRGTDRGQVEGSAYPTTDPVRAISAGGVHHGLLMRNNSALGDGGHLVTPTSEPTRTMTTAGHQSLLMPYYGQSIPHPTDRPVGTVTTKDRHALIDTAAAVDDCGFRMLAPHEIEAAMGHPARPGTTDHLTKKDRVKLAGNAVTPPVMEWLVGRVIQAMEAQS